MRVSSRWSVAALVATLAAPTVPAAADYDESFGLLCGFTSTNDPTGVVNQNPDTQFGEMDFGPYFGADVIADDGSGPSPHPGPGLVTMRCWIQVNNEANGGMGGSIPSADCTVSGVGVAVGACQISYTATTTDNVYLCGSLYIYHPPWHKHWYFDADDDPTNGTQCSLAISAGG